MRLLEGQSGSSDSYFFADPVLPVLIVGVRGDGSTRAVHLGYDDAVAIFSYARDGTPRPFARGEPSADAYARLDMAIECAVEIHAAACFDPELLVQCLGATVVHRTETTDSAIWTKGIGFQRMVVSLHRTTPPP
jgi:hypothetical protein